MVAAGADLGTVLSQPASVIMAFAAIRKKKEFALHLTGRDLRPEREPLGEILKIGVPVACQDGVIQIPFILIMVIANQRGVVAALTCNLAPEMILGFFSAQFDFNGCCAGSGGLSGGSVFSGYLVSYGIGGTGRLAFVIGYLYCCVLVFQKEGNKTAL